MLNKKSKKLSLIIIAAVLTAVIFTIVFFVTKKDNNASGRQLEITGIDSITSFLESYGYTVNPVPVQCRTFTLPQEFTDVLQNYNELQMSQNFDLSLYKGKSITVWSFTVTNYPGYTDTQTIRADVFVYGGKIIGGDVCSTEIDGFMHGFERNGEKNGKTKT